jgi:hypothetical protein
MAGTASAHAEALRSLSGGAPLAQLLQEHRGEVAALKTLVGAIGAAAADGTLYDDVFLLRFVLSNKGREAGEVTDKVRECVAWRKKHAALLVALSKGERHPQEKAVSEFLFSGTTGSLGGGEPIAVVRMGLSDFRKLMSSFSVDEVSEYLTVEKERTFRVCDAETRKRGRIVKSITVIDFADFSMFGGRFDNRFFTALGNSSKASSTLYPQMQAKTVAINTPSYYAMVNKSLGAVMPKSSMDKFVLHPKATSKQSAASCPFVARFEALQAVPPFLGGKGACPRELQPPGERDGEVPLQKITVASRSYALVELPIEARDTMVEFEVCVDAYHILLDAELLPFTTAELNEMEGRKEKLPRHDSGGAEGELKVDHHKRDRQAKGDRKSCMASPLSPRAPRCATPTTEDKLAAARAGKRLSLNPQRAPLRLDAKEGMLKACWKIPTAGRLVVRFDNSHSLVRAKQVTFRITTVPPPEDEAAKSWWDLNYAEFAGMIKWPTTADEAWECVLQ